MAGRGLSYQQGPALAGPMRLFLLAPPFLMLAAAAGLVSAGDWLSGRWSPATLALTHLITLGFLGTVMQGALLQMLPVVLGSPVPGAGRLSLAGAIGLGLGTPALALGFQLGEPAWLAVALAFLALAWLPFLAGIAVALTRALSGSAMDWPIRLAAAALLVTAASGLALAGGLAGLWPLPDLAFAVDLHVAWGLFGWVLVLVVGVAYQVVPMLQLTPYYPAWLSRILAWLLPAGLLGWSLAAGFGHAEPAARLMGAGAVLVFALATLHLLRRRRRRLPDVSLDFWRLALAGLVLAALLFAGLAWLPEAWRPAAELAVGLAFLVGFAVSVVSGMLYKIVPFLAWFHLQGQTGARAGTIPNMREMIDETAMRRHYRLHLAAVCLLLPAPFLPAWAVAPGLVALLASAQVLWLNLIAARRRFLAYGGRL